MVIAILAILSAILFPVFSRVRMAARKAVCISNFHQAQLATSLYLDDYEDRFMPVNHQPGGPLNSRVDRTWVQMVLPYARSFSVFRCPEDKIGDRVSDSTFDEDLVPGDSFSQYYTASQHVNTGYNYQYLAPIVWNGSAWTSTPRISTQFADPSRTLLFVDSVGSRDVHGNPTGGGSWLVSPPCRYIASGRNRVDSFDLGSNSNPRSLNGFVGWDLRSPNSPYRFGGAWQWHTSVGTVVKLDGSVRPMSPSALSAGCDVRTSWLGNIVDTNLYQWDFQ